jgi:hypothetical protein
MNWEMLLLFAVAALIYQEVSWRDRARRLEADFEKRLSTELAMAHEAGLLERNGPVRAFTFRAEKEEPRGLFGEVTRPLFLAVTMHGDTVKYAAGDFEEIDRIVIPPEIKRAIQAFIVPGSVVAAGPREA